jgi:hypothetical protein
LIVRRKDKGALLSRDESGPSFAGAARLERSPRPRAKPVKQRCTRITAGGVSPQRKGPGVPAPGPNPIDHITGLHALRVSPRSNLPLERVASKLFHYGKVDRDFAPGYRGMCRSLIVADDPCKGMAHPVAVYRRLAKYPEFRIMYQCAMLARLSEPRPVSYQVAGDIGAPRR